MIDLELYKIYLLKKLLMFVKMIIHYCFKNEILKFSTHNLVPLYLSLKIFPL